MERRKPTYLDYEDERPAVKAKAKAKPKVAAYKPPRPSSPQSQQQYQHSKPQAQSQSQPILSRPSPPVIRTASPVKIAAANAHTTPVAAGGGGGVLLWIILLAIPLILVGVWLYTVSVAQTKFLRLRNKRICLLIAHPDDEAMFFAPSVVALTDPSLGNHVKILCLSSGMSFQWCELAAESNREQETLMVWEKRARRSW